MSSPLLAFRIWVCSPIVRAAASKSANSGSLFGLFGLTSSPTAVVFGLSSRNNSRRFAPSGPASIVAPVILMPGRLRLVTRPDPTGSDPAMKTIRILPVAPFATRVGKSPDRNMNGDETTDQTDDQRRHALGMPIRPAIFDGHVPALGEPRFRQSLAKRDGKLRRRVGLIAVDDVSDYRHRDGARPRGPALNFYHRPRRRFLQS